MKRYRIMGFTLIELMIVIAIIGVIAAIAIPNLLRSRIQANEANAIAALKSYSTAQTTFHVGRQGRVTTNTTTGPQGFADNFRNLFFGNPAAMAAAGGTAAPDTTKNLALINQSFASAPAGGIVSLTGTVNTPTAPGLVEAYKGYHFGEPPGVTSADFTSGFQLVAVPAASGSTGSNGFWIGSAGMLWMVGLDSGKTDTESYALDVMKKGKVPESGTTTDPGWKPN